MFDILSGIGSLINPASAIASTVLGQLFGEDRQQQAPQVMYPQAPPQQVIVQEPPPPPVHPLVETGYFNNAFASGGLVGPPGPLSQFLTAGGATTIQGVNGRELPALQAMNPGFAPMANQLNQWLSGDLSFMSPVGYADGGLVGVSDEEIVQQAMAAVAGVAENSDEIIQEFTSRFGEQALMDLASKAKAMGNVAPEPPEYGFSNMRNHGDIYEQPRRGQFGYLPTGEIGYVPGLGGNMTMGRQSNSMLGYLPADNVLPGTAASVPMKEIRKNDEYGAPMGSYRPTQDQDFIRKDINAYLPPIPMEPKSDGLSDSVPAMINGQTPAALSEGEFVVPADVVSGIGNGSTSAGAKRLLEMIENVRKARTGKEAAPPKIRVER